MLDIERVKIVQHRLLELGYTDTGIIDGDPGFSTQGAILDFRNRNGLPLTPTVDDDLIAALATADPIKRPLRVSEATVAEIAPKVEAMNRTWWTKTLAWMLTVPSLVTSIAIGIVDHLGDAIDKLSPLKYLLSEYLSSIPPLTLVLVVMLAVAAVAALLWWQSVMAEAALVDGFKRGTVRNDNVQQKALEQTKGVT